MNFMPRPKQRNQNEVRKLIDLDKDTIKAIAKDAIDRDLQGFKQNAERILKEYAQKLENKNR